jgi:glutamate racemase
MSEEEKPIGIFDSGIGGLTVLKEIFRELPQERSIYLGDTARVPYGIRSPETVTRYSFDNTNFLISKNIKVLVVACNTASSVSLESIKDSVQVPVIGVIEPGAKAAVASTKNKKVGVIGTEATIKSNSYSTTIKSIDSDIDVFSLPCPLFVPLAEEGWTDDDLVEKIAERYLKNISNKGIDTLVLGCTHYPLLKNVISRVMGKNVVLIDSAIETSKATKTILSNLSLLRNATSTAAHEYYVTDSPEKFKDVGERFLGKKLENIKKIQLEMEV